MASPLSRLNHRLAVGLYSKELHYHTSDASCRSVVHASFWRSRRHLPAGRGKRTLVDEWADRPANALMLGHIHHLHAKAKAAAHPQPKEQLALVVFSFSICDQGSSRHGPDGSAVRTGQQAVPCSISYLSIAGGCMHRGYETRRSSLPAPAPVSPSPRPALD